MKESLNTYFVNGEPIRFEVFFLTKYFLFFLDSHA